MYYSFNGDDLSTDEVEMRAMFSRLQVGDETFSDPVDISDAPYNEGVFHSFMFLATGSSSCDVRAAWMDNRTGAWNVWYRESVDCGTTFSSPSVRLSWSDNPGFNFQSSAGFTFPYGDYGSMTVDSDDNTHIVWGEGMGWYAGGTVMYATQAKTKSSNSKSSGMSDQEVLIMTAVLTAVGGIIVGAAVALFAVRSFAKQDNLLKKGKQSGDL